MKINRMLAVSVLGSFLMVSGSFAQDATQPGTADTKAKVEKTEKSKSKHSKTAKKPAAKPADAAAPATDAPAAAPAK